MTMSSVYLLGSICIGNEMIVFKMENILHSVRRPLRTKKLMLFLPKCYIKKNNFATQI